MQHLRLHRSLANAGLLAILASSLLSLPGSSRLSAGDGDWPQWRGPERNGHAAPQSLLQEWPEGGPEVKWQYTNAGAGYSAMSIADGQLLTMGERDEKCWVICLDATSGELKWETAIDRASTSDDYTHRWGGGPRSTPTIDGEHIYALSDLGTLACLKKADGEELWSVSLVDQFGGKVPNWGYSESVLVDGDRVVATPGESQFMVALDKKTGEQVWGSKGVDAPAQYVSIIKHSVGSTSFYVTATEPGLVAFDTKSGAKLFENTATGNTTAVIPTPVVRDDLLYHTSAYGGGNVLLRLSETGQGGIDAEEVYHLSTKSMENHHGGVVLLDGVIYGFTNAGRGQWMAQDLETGEDLWWNEVEDNRSGAICYADGRLYCYNDTEGSLYLVEPSPKSWIEKGKLTLPEQTELERGLGAIWAHPVVADQTLFLRDQDLIYAFDIAR